jgi:uncharacterized protein YrrD
MSESFRHAAGRKVVSRTSAQELGTLNHLLVDDQQRQVASIVMGRGKKAQLIDWAHVTGFGPDAVMVADDSSLRSPANDREDAASEGKLELVGKRTLSELGNELGQIDDVTFDADSGALEELVIGERRVPAGSLLGSGSYAAVLERNQEP